MNDLAEYFRYAAGLLAAVASTVAVVSAADAHHVVSQYGIAPAEPVTRAALQLEVRQFEFGADGPAGTAVVATPRIEYAPVSWLSGSARLPIAHVDYRDRRAGTGIGDLSLGAQARLFATEHGGLIVSSGVGLELPTGATDDGLGGGHTELAPFVVVSGSPTDRWVIFGSITQQISLGGADAHGHGEDHTHSHDDPPSVHGAVIAPHRDHETRTSFGAAHIFDPFYISATSSLIVAWSRDRPVGPFISGMELGWRPLSSFRVAVAADAPVVGPDRFSWKSSLSAAWTF